MLPGNIPERMSAEEYRRLLASGAPGGAWRGKVAKPTEVDGHTFPSMVQAEVYRYLVAEARLKVKAEETVVIRDPIFDLESIPLGEKDAKYRPDFLVLRFKIRGAFDAVEVHEAKGNKGAESRDWRLRVGALRGLYPSLPVFVWRSFRKKVRVQTWEEFLCSK